MECARCGSRDVVALKDGDALCGECSTQRDWQELIAIVQDAHVQTPVAGSGPMQRTA